MSFDIIYQDGKPMMTLASGMTVSDIMTLFNTKKRKVISVERNLQPDGSSIWNVKTEVRKPSMVERFLKLFK